MSDKELKNCPLCESEAKSFGESYPFIYCTNKNCGISISGFRDLTEELKKYGSVEDYLIHKWNTRPESKLEPLDEEKLTKVIFKEMFKAKVSTNGLIFDLSANKISSAICKIFGTKKVSVEEIENIVFQAKQRALMYATSLRDIDKILAVAIANYVNGGKE